RGRAREDVSAGVGARRAGRGDLGAGAAEVGALRRACRRRHSRNAQRRARRLERGRGRAAVVRGGPAAARGTVRRVKPDSSRTAYDGRLFDVTVERWGEHDREIVEHPGAVAIVAVDNDGKVALVRQRREAVREYLLELPAGTLEAGESPLESARRELEEETGLTGGTRRELGAVYTTPGVFWEGKHGFVAAGVGGGGAGLRRGGGGGGGGEAGGGGGARARPGGRR